MSNDKKSHPQKVELLEIKIGISPSEALSVVRVFNLCAALLKDHCDEMDAPTLHDAIKLLSSGEAVSTRILRQARRVYELNNSKGEK